VIATHQLGTSKFFVLSGPDGHFALDVLAPGPQLVCAFVNRRKDLLVRAVDIEPGRRAHADLEVHSGPIMLTVDARDDAGRPIDAHVLVTSPAVEPADGETLAALRARFTPAEPTVLYQRDGAGPLSFEGLAPGRYAICAARLGPASALRCLVRDLGATATVAVTAP
jgi:hypothetical protein